MEWQTTSTILGELRDHRNETAWPDFVERFREPIRRFAMSLGLPEQESEDVAQEALLAFAEAYRDGKYQRERGRLSSWLFGITYRHVLRGRRNRVRAPANVAGDTGGTDYWAALPDESTLAEQWDQQWQAAVLRQCLQRVRVEFEPTTVEAFELSVRDGRSAEEVATALNVPLKSVYNAKHRVLNRIRQLTEELEVVD